MEATNPRCYALLPLGAVAYVGAVQIALEVSFRSHQTGLRLLIPHALSRPIIFQRLPGLVPQARLEFCHSGRGGVDVEFREFLSYLFLEACYTQSFAPARVAFVRFGSSFWISPARRKWIARRCVRSCGSSLLSGHDTFAATG